MKENRLTPQDTCSVRVPAKSRLGASRGLSYRKDGFWQSRSCTVCCLIEWASRQHVAFMNELLPQALQSRAQALGQEYAHLSDQECVKKLRDELPDHLKRHLEDPVLVEMMMGLAKRGRAEEEKQALLRLAAATALLEETTTSNPQ